jgi:hypothetical protein
MLLFTAAPQKRVFRTIITGHPPLDAVYRQQGRGCDGGQPYCGILCEYGSLPADRSARAAVCRLFYSLS